MRRNAHIGALLLAIGAFLAHASWRSPVQAKRKQRHDAGVLQGLDCSACHTTDSWSLSNRAGASGAFDHAKMGFPLTGEHGAVLCTSCHAPKKRVRRECFSCHTDKHRGRLGRQCDACHNSRSWQQTRAIRRHRLTRLPLTGMHAVLACTSCHIRRGNRQFLPVPSDCFACHEKDYRADIHPRHQRDPADSSLVPLSRDCAQCHQPSGWSPAFVNPDSLRSAITRATDQHDRTFILSRGPHRGARCESCHLSEKVRQVVSCNGCHVHSSVELRRRHGRPVPQAASSCLRCHPRGVGR